LRTRVVKDLGKDLITGKNQHRGLWAVGNEIGGMGYERIVPFLDAAREICGDSSRWSTNHVRTSAFSHGIYISKLTCGRSIGGRNIHEDEVPRSSTDVQSVDAIKEGLD
jgi:hypothetical protein